MRTLLRAALLAVLLLAVLAGVAVAYVWNTGLSARTAPGRVETLVARQIRDLAVARSARNVQNPVPRAPEAIAAGLAHFADHCASCHANDGSGNTAMNRGLFPRAPDMRETPTQQLSDGELFWIIENGIRFTGMPGWGTADPSSADGSWQLVHFIRYLPHLTPADLKHMEALNPRSPEEIRQEIEEEEFLSGGDAPPSTPATPHRHPGGQDE